MATAALAAEGSDRFLEAHFYQAGLRIKPLGSGGGRPTWAPPADWIGFRDEHALQGGDVAVELARFAVDGRRITWLGVYRKAIDHVHGDRQNHEGVGVWLCESSIVNGEILLNGLLQLLDLVHPDTIAQLDVQAARFLASDYLPSYVVSIASLPDELTGWRHSPSQLSETELLTIGHADTGEVWRDVAEQLLRISWLSDGRPFTRAVILVPAPDRRTMPATGRQPNAGRLLTDLVRVLPQAFSSMSALQGNQKQLLEHATAETADLRTRLAQAVADRDAKSTRLALLEQEIAQNDTLKSLVTIKEGIARIDSTTSGIRADVDRIGRASSQPEPVAPLSSGFGSARAPVGKAHRPRTGVMVGPDSIDDAPFWTSGYFFLAIVLVIVAAVVAIVLTMGPHPGF